MPDSGSNLLIYTKEVNVKNELFCHQEGNLLFLHDRQSGEETGSKGAADGKARNGFEMYGWNA